MFMPVGEYFLHWLKARLRRTDGGPQWGPRAPGASRPTRTPPHPALRSTIWTVRAATKITTSMVRLT